jgi:hypothetical protein
MKFRRQQIDTATLPKRILEKWPASTLTEGFVPFPKKLLRRMREIFGDEDPLEALAVVLAIVDFKRPDLPRPPSTEFLSYVAGMEQIEFERVLKRLEQRGLVRISGDQEQLDVSLDGLVALMEKEGD